MKACSCLPDVFYPVAGSAEEVALVVGVGAQFVQLRFKSSDLRRIRQEIRSSLAFCRIYGACLVVNDHWQIALDEGAEFVHLGQGDLLGADVPHLRRYGVKLGVSTHDLDELERALDMEPDYIALGPIWPTTLKVMPWAPQGLERVQDWARRIHPLPLVAIGGITLARCVSCLEAGAASVAVVSDIFCQPDPAAQARAWQKALKQGLS